MILTMMMMIQKIYMSQMCDTCSFPVFQNGHCDGDDDDDYDDGDDDTLSVRKATGDTDVCHEYVLEDGDDARQGNAHVMMMLMLSILTMATKPRILFNRMMMTCRW